MRGMTSWEIEQHQRIDQALRYHERTGRCVICRHLPGEPGVTCGRTACVTAWIRGHLPKIAIVVTSIERV